MVNPQKQPIGETDPTDRGDGYTVKEVIDAAQQITGREIATRVGPRRAGGANRQLREDQTRTWMVPKISGFEVDHSVGVGLVAGPSGWIPCGVACQKPDRKGGQRSPCSRAGF